MDTGVGKWFRDTKLGGGFTPFNNQEWHYGKYADKKPLSIQIDPTKTTFYGQDIDRLMREALKDNPIDEMVKLITQRHEIQQSINTLLPKMTKDEITEVYHTLYRIAQRVDERES